MALKNRLRAGNPAAWTQAFHDTYKVPPPPQPGWKPPAAPRPRGFTPYRPPAGTYDPTLDAELRGAQRGFGDLADDWGYDAEGNPTGRLAQRLQSQFSIGKGELELSGTQAREDFGRARSRQGEDYGRAIADLRRGYERLGESQGEQARVAGVQAGGALAQSLRKRVANEAIDRDPIEQSNRRATEDLDTQESRMFDPANGSLARRLAALGQGYQYDVSDAGVNLSRGGRELGAFEVDTSAQKLFQAQQSGMLPGRGQPGGPPGNEFVDARGVYRRLGGGRRRRPSGVIDTRSQRRRATGLPGSSK